MANVHCPSIRQIIFICLAVSIFPLDRVDAHALSGLISHEIENSSSLMAAVQTDLKPGLYRIANPQIIQQEQQTPPTLEKVIKTIKTVTAISLPAVATIAVAASAASTAIVIASSPTSFLTIIQALLPFLVLRKRSLPWGRVIEEETSQPVAGAVVTIFDSHGRPRSTIKTRSDGTFGALLPKGTYQMTVDLEGYELAEKPRNISLFPGENLYTGVAFTVNTDDEMLAPMVIPLRPIIQGWIWTPYVFTLWNRLRVWQARYSVYILVTGAFITTFMLLQNQQNALIILALIYLSFLILELLMSRVMKRALGLVRDAKTRIPIPLAMARLLDAKTNRLVATEVTLPGGHFLLLPKPGLYTLHVIHPQYEPYIKKPVVINSWSLGSVSFSIDLNKKNKT